MTDEIKDGILEEVRRRSLAEAEHLAGEFARAAEREREAILAELEFHWWFVESCDECRQPQ